MGPLAGRDPSNVNVLLDRRFGARSASRVASRPGGNLFRWPRPRRFPITLPSRASQRGTHKTIACGLALVMAAGCATLPELASALPGGGGMPLNSTAIYDLFWGRMDYLLGRRDEWMTCDEAEARRKAGITYGQLEALCSVTTDDLPPE